VPRHLPRARAQHRRGAALRGHARGQPRPRQLQLASAQPAETAAIALRRLRYVVPYDAGWIGQVDEAGRDVVWLAANPDGVPTLHSHLDDARGQTLRATREGPVAAGDQAIARMKDELITHLSHGMRNPLTMLLGGSELLAAGAASPTSVAPLAQHVHLAATQLKRLVDDVLDLAAGERTGWELNRVPCDVAQLLDEAVGAVAGPQQRARVTVTVPPMLPKLDADPARLRQVFVNLIGNALKYSPRGGPVRVLCEQRDGGVEVRVVDQGVGIPPEAVGRVFEKFYRAPNELARGIPGTGLGLAITRQLVEAHRGRIWVESAGLGKGSTFAVRLPLPARVGADA
jgi:signal transduction histidine kinase